MTCYAIKTSFFASFLALRGRWSRSRHLKSPNTKVCHLSSHCWTENFGIRAVWTWQVGPGWFCAWHSFRSPSFWQISTPMNFHHFGFISICFKPFHVDPYGPIIPICPDAWHLRTESPNASRYRLVDGTWVHVKRQKQLEVTPGANPLKLWFRFDDRTGRKETLGRPSLPSTGGFHV